ncbi:MAG TPA: ABC transporter permease [Thermoplasmata archaeon]|nr:ABC transporter permease [Thermoplasmata archaeon]
MTPTPVPGSSAHAARRALSGLIKVQWRLALREPYWAFGFVFPIALLVLFWWIGVLHPGNVAGSGLTVLELYIPTILAISYIALGMYGLPVTFARDREIGWLRRVSTTPIRPAMLLAAQLFLNLIVAAAATVIVIVAGSALFGAPLVVGVEFVGVAIFALIELFSLGLVVAAIAPTQQSTTYLAGGLMFLLLFFSGLWIQPVQVGGALQTIMYYSPSGAAVRALLYSVFNATPPYMTLVTMAVYTVIFAYVAIRYFRWE